ncbi:hypothetical protein AVEN_264948-1 [Araneus ventricosus]|uniref:Uncharacterized protein n=1 Tax=Araneus ventricosus TaxID=182803 RepID=A0A4Y2MVM6_ARAVE|nr:hypothetical protein AVEN_264948-1 [Araneus ventricosus]
MLESPILFPKLKLTSVRSGPWSRSVSKTQDCNPTWEKYKSGSKMNPQETALVPIPREEKKDLPLKTQVHLLSIARPSHHISGISFHKILKDRRQSFILTISSLTKAGFATLVYQKFTFCILLRILHCPLPYMLETLSIDACVKQHLQRGWPP